MAPLYGIHQFFGRTPLLVRSIVAYAVLGALVIGLGIVFRPPTPLFVPVIPYVAPTKVGTAQYVVEGSPQRIRVERLGIDLPVSPGVYDAKTGEWTLSDSAAYFATVTDKPNDFKGSTFLYGHNRRSVFGPLADIQPGDTVKVSTDNGHTFTYTYARDASINPDMTSILYEHPEPPQLVLMTCEGVLSTTRRVMYFTLTGVDA